MLASPEIKSMFWFFRQNAGIYRWIGRLVRSSERSLEATGPQAPIRGVDFGHIIVPDLSSKVSESSQRKSLRGILWYVRRSHIDFLLTLANLSLNMEKCKAKRFFPQAVNTRTGSGSWSTRCITFKYQILLILLHWAYFDIGDW